MSGFFLAQGMYPAWKEVYDALNAFGTFDDAFTHRMGWSTPVYERESNSYIPSILSPFKTF